RLGRSKEAIAAYTESVRLKPTGLAYNGRAKLHYSAGNYEAARADHESALRFLPDDASTMNYLAWILATCPVDSLRNGKRAIELATRACEKTEWKASFCLDTLAAAFAEIGRFADAIKHAERVLTLVEEPKREQYERRLALYKAGRAYRDQ